jgi:hypothetical protein
VGDVIPPWLARATQLCSAQLPGLTPGWGVEVAGKVTLLAQTLEGSILLSSCGLEVRSSVDLGDFSIGNFRLPGIGTVQSVITVRFAPFRMCISGSINTALDIALPTPQRPLVRFASSIRAAADMCAGEASEDHVTADSGAFMKIDAREGVDVQFTLPLTGVTLFTLRGEMDVCVGTGDKQGQPGIFPHARSSMRAPAVS